MHFPYRQYRTEPYEDAEIESYAISHTKRIVQPTRAIICLPMGSSGSSTSPCRDDSNAAVDRFISNNISLRW